MFFTDNLRQNTSLNCSGGACRTRVSHLVGSFDRLCEEDVQENANWLWKQNT